METEGRYGTAGGERVDWSSSEGSYYYEDTGASSTRPTSTPPIRSPDRGGSRDGASAAGPC